MKVLITGGHGMLARALVRVIQEPVTAVDIQDYDLTDENTVHGMIRDIQPGLVIHTAAMTDVDGCEDNRDGTERINATAVGYLAEACERHRARLVHVSTDYVFSGASHHPYREDDPTDPISVYGATKLRGEELASGCLNHLIVRVSWLFGPGKAHFIDLMKRFLSEGRSLKVISDQVNRLTYTHHAAEAILDLSFRDVTGIVHFANEGASTRYEQVLWMAEYLGSASSVEAVGSDFFKQKARRPSYSVLDTSRYSQLTGRRPPDWKSALKEYFDSQ